MRGLSVQRVYSGGVTVLVLTSTVLLSAASAEVQCTQLTCPANIVVETRDPSGAVVTYPAPTGTGTCNIEQTQGLPSGDTFPLGTTRVGFRDKVDTAVSCSFAVIVTLISPVPALRGSALSAMTAALAGLGIWVVRRRSRRLAGGR
jgi:hypothetical protein